MFGRIEGYRVVVTEATEPNPKDKRTRTSFVLDVATANQEIAERFRQGLQYLGDWHTHPEARPKPSSEDRTNAGRMFKTTFGRPWFLMIIVGRYETWVGVYNQHSIVRLAEVR
jgi:integrative and conjugative element protein (TIGR02256 family)